MQPFSINYKKKTLIPPEEIGVFAVKGENKSTRYYFEIDTNLARSDWDLKKGTWSVKYKNAKGETGEQILTDVLTASNLIRASFLIPGTLTKEQGTVSIELCCTLASEDKHWHVSPFECTVGPFINVNEITADDPKYDAINQMIGWFQQYPDPTDLNTLINDVHVASIQLSNSAKTLSDLTGENTKATTNITNLRNLNSQGTTLNTNLTNSINSANTAKTNLDSTTSAANTAKTNLQNATTAANTSKTNLETATSAANTAKTNLQNATTVANTAKTNLDTSVTTANTVDTKVNQTISEAEAAKEELAVLIGSAPASVTTNNNELRAKCTRSGIEIMHIKGKTEQLSSNGYQLFDMSKFKDRFTQNGGTVYNNKDGSYSGFGTLTGILGDERNLERSILKSGKIKFSTQCTSPYSYFKIIGLGETASSTLGEINITQDKLDDSNSEIKFGYYGYTNKQLTARSYKPMLYQDGDGTWEPFTGGKPGPNPEYPLPLNSVTFDKIVMIGNNFAVFSDKMLASNCTFSVNYGGLISLKVTGKNPIIGNVGIVGYHISEINRPGNFIPIPESANNVYNKTSISSIRSTVAFYDSYKRNIGPKDFPEDMNAHSIEIPKAAKYLTVATQPINTTVGQTLSYKEMFSFSPITEWEPPYYEEITLPEPIILRSCATGEYDEYLGDGKILRRCGVYTTDADDLSSYEYELIQAYSRFDVTVQGAKIQDGRMKVYCNRGFRITNDSGEASHTEDTAFLGGNCKLFAYMPKSVTSVSEAKTFITNNPYEFIYPLEEPYIETIDMPILPSTDSECTAFLINSQAYTGGMYKNMPVETEITWRPCPLSDPIKRVQETETQVAENTTSIEYLQTQITTLQTQIAQLTQSGS